jgi:hypothetical protein
MICDNIRRGADKSLGFPILFDGLKKLEQRSHKCVELRGEYVEQIHFFKPVACYFLYKAKNISAPLVFSKSTLFSCGNCFVECNITTWLPCEEVLHLFDLMAIGGGPSQAVISTWYAKVKVKLSV